MAQEKKSGGSPLVAIAVILVLGLVAGGAVLGVMLFKPDLAAKVMGKGTPKTDLAQAPDSAPEQTPETDPVANVPVSDDVTPAVEETAPLTDPEPLPEESTEPTPDETTPAVTPEEPPAATPVEKPADKPAETPVDKPADKPADKPKDKPKTADTNASTAGPRKWYVHVGNCLEAAEARSLQADLNGRWSEFGLKQDQDKGLFFSFWKVGPKEGKDAKSFNPEDFCYQVRTGSISQKQAKILETKLTAMGKAAGTGTLK